MAVVSNFDTRLRPLLKALKCDHWFDAVAVSAEVSELLISINLLLSVYIILQSNLLLLLYIIVIYFETGCSGEAKSYDIFESL